MFIYKRHHLLYPVTTPVAEFNPLTEMAFSNHLSGVENEGPGIFTRGHGLNNSKWVINFQVNDNDLVWAYLPGQSNSFQAVGRVSGVEYKDPDDDSRCIFVITWDTYLSKRLKKIPLPLPDQKCVSQSAPKFADKNASIPLDNYLHKHQAMLVGLGPNLQNMDLKNANLNGNLEGCYIAYGDLRNANLENSSLRGANLEFADLSDANLKDADLGRNPVAEWDWGAEYDWRTRLYGAKLSRANLRGASFSGAFMAKANLSGADLSGAYLSGADLRNSNLTEATLHGADLKDCYWDDYTIWPEGFTPPETANKIETVRREDLQ
jgi:hypothetical protein